MVVRGRAAGELRSEPARDEASDLLVRLETNLDLASATCRELGAAIERGDFEAAIRGRSSLSHYRDALDFLAAHAAHAVHAASLSSGREARSARLRAARRRVPSVKARAEVLIAQAPEPDGDDVLISLVGSGLLQTPERVARRQRWLASLGFPTEQEPPPIPGLAAWRAAPRDTAGPLEVAPPSPFARQPPGREGTVAPGKPAPRPSGMWVEIRTPAQIFREIPQAAAPGPEAARAREPASGLDLLRTDPRTFEPTGEILKGKGRRRVLVNDATDDYLRIATEAAVPGAEAAWIRREHVIEKRAEPLLKRRRVEPEEEEDPAEVAEPEEEEEEEGPEADLPQGTRVVA